MANIQERRDKTGKLISYSIRVHRGRGADGKQLKPWTATFEVSPTWKEDSARKKAEAFAATFEKECKEGTTSDSRRKFSEYCDYVISLKETRGAKHSTVVWYKEQTARIYPEIGHIKLRKLTGRDIQIMYNNVRDHGRVLKGPNDKRDKSLSASYIHSLHRMLKMCLERAVREELLIRNPCDNVVLPKVEREEMKILKPEYIKAYLAEAERRGCLPMMFLELCSGLRKGELAALLWEDLDIENKTISINKQATRVKGGGVKITRPKTATSIRKEPIPQQAVDLLIQEHEKHPDSPYMFPSPVTGGMLYPDSLNDINEKILDAIGVERVRFHDLRHTFATIALQSGVDIRTVSGMLGHSDPGFTLRTYTHVTNPMQVKAAETVGNVIGSKL